MLLLSCSVNSPLSAVPPMVGSPILPHSQSGSNSMLGLRYRLAGHVHAEPVKTSWAKVR